MASIAASPLLAAYLSRTTLSSGGDGAAARPGLFHKGRPTGRDQCLDVKAVVAQSVAATGASWMAIAAATPRGKRQALAAPPYGGSDPAASTVSPSLTREDAEILRLPVLDADYFTPDPPSVTSSIVSKQQTDAMLPREWRDEVLAVNRDRKRVGRAPVWWTTFAP